MTRRICRSAAFFCPPIMSARASARPSPTLVSSATARWATASAASASLSTGDACFFASPNSADAAPALTRPSAALAAAPAASTSAAAAASFLRRKSAHGKQPSLLRSSASTSDDSFFTAWRRAASFRPFSASRSILGASSHPSVRDRLSARSRLRPSE